jgi:hypothetical protein
LEKVALGNLGAFLWPKGPKNIAQGLQRPVHPNNSLLKGQARSDKPKFFRADQLNAVAANSFFSRLTLHGHADKGHPCKPLKENTADAQGQIRFCS